MGCRKHSQEAIAITQARDDGGLNQGGSKEVGEKRLDFSYILEER